MHQENTSLFGGSLSASELVQQAMHTRVLGALCFTTNAGSAQAIKANATLPCLHVPMKSLGGTDSVCESWLGLGPLQEGSAGDIQYQHDDDVLFGVLHLHEAAFQAGNETLLQQATESAYRQIFALIAQLNFPHIFRFWNYIAEINADSDELERYRQFNMGRHKAFLACQRDVVGNVPAACALGFSQPEQGATLSIAFLAGCVEPVTIENPRQMSAYQYPEQYGPVSPTFSRATLVNLKQRELLLISGTASIVGHATQHSADAIVQAREAMMNIAAVLAEANANSIDAKFSLADLHYRAYVRHPSHVNEVHEELIRYIGTLPKVTYLQADICRRDLLLEIEATAEYPSVLSTAAKG